MTSWPTSTRRWRRRPRRRHSRARPDAALGVPRPAVASHGQDVGQVTDAVHSGLGGSVGLATTQRVGLFDETRPLALESGHQLAPVEVAFETYGDARRRSLERDLHLPRADRRRPRRGPPWRSHAARVVGQLHRARQAGRHRPVLRGLREPARRLHGHDRAVVDQPGDGRALRAAVSAVHRRGSGQRPAGADAPPRRRVASWRRSAGRSAACRSCSGRWNSPTSSPPRCWCARPAACRRRTSRSRRSPVRRSCATRTSTAATTSASACARTPGSRWRA